MILLTPVELTTINLKKGKKEKQNIFRMYFGKNLLEHKLAIIFVHSDGFRGGRGEATVFLETG